MACFEFLISFREALINLVNKGYKSIIKIQKDKISTTIKPVLTNPKINIAIVCDINYGVPLYATDGSIYTIDGKAVYVRTAKLIDYE